MSLLERIVAELHRRYSGDSVEDSKENLEPEPLVSRCLPDKDEHGYEVIIIYALVSSKSVGYLRSLNCYDELTNKRTAFLKGANGYLGFDVAPEYQGKGIGTFLMRTMMELLKSEGFGCVYINEPVSTAINIYDSMLSKLKDGIVISNYEKIPVEGKGKFRVQYRIEI